MSTNTETYEFAPGALARAREIARDADIPDRVWFDQIIPLADQFLRMEIRMDNGVTRVDFCLDLGRLTTIIHNQRPLDRHTVQVITNYLARLGEAAAESENEMGPHATGMAARYAVLIRDIEGMLPKPEGSE